MAEEIFGIELLPGTAGHQGTPVLRPAAAIVIADQEVPQMGIIQDGAVFLAEMGQRLRRNAASDQAILEADGVC